MKPNFSARIKKLRALMKKDSLDSVLITSNNDILYYSGVFLGESEKAFMVISNEKPVLFLSPLLNMYHSSGAVKVELIKKLNDVKNTIPKGVSGFDDRNISVYLKNKIRKKGVKWKAFSSQIKAPRMIKDDYEVSVIRKSIAITEEVLSNLKISGKKEYEVAREIKSGFVERGAKEAFETIVASGPNAGLIHYIPGKRKIRKKDLVIIDCGARYNGYCTDMTRTHCESPGTKEKNIFSDVLEVQEEIIKGLKEGISFDCIENVSAKLLEKKGYKPAHSIGHGVGLSVHERPFFGDSLKKGMLLTIEPGVYIKGWGGCRIEDMVLVGKNTALTRLKKKL